MDLRDQLNNRISQFLAKLAENSENVYWLCSPNFDRITYISPSYEKIWGRPRELLYDNPNICIEYLYPDDRKNHHAIFDMVQIVAQIGEAARYDEKYRIVRPDGEVRWIIDRGFPVFDQNGLCCGMTGVAVDITQESLKQKAVNEARVLAEQANLSKSEFLATMSHELRTPLNAILGMAQIIKQSDLDTVQRQYIDAIYQSGHHLLALISDILEFAKIEAGKLELCDGPFNLRSLIEEVVNSLSKKAHEKDLSLLIEYPDDVPRHLIADSRRVRQILMNLVSNSIKFTNVGHILIAVDVVELQETSTVLQISVEDTGAGISQLHVEKIFERFTQADLSYERPHEGLGLGLAITKELIELMAGKIGVNSQLDVGSTFWCTIPFALQTQKVEEHYVWKPEMPLRTLIIDDNPVSRDVLLQCTRVIGGYAVQGDAAIDILNESLSMTDPFNIVIIDEHLNSVNTINLVRKMLQQVAFKQMMLVLLADTPLDKLSGEYAELGFYCYVPKPVQPSELIPMIASNWRRWKNSFSLSNDIHKPVRVLLVEDNPLNQKIEKVLIEGLGCSVDVAENGKQALAMLQEYYDLIFMDIGLPDISGLKVAQLIRDRGGYYAHIPILALTAHVLDSDRNKCVEAGMNDVITKPIIQNQLQSIVGYWLQRSLSERKAKSEIIHS